MFSKCSKALLSIPERFGFVLIEKIMQKSMKTNAKQKQMERLEAVIGRAAYNASSVLALSAGLPITEA